MFRIGDFSRLAHVSTRLLRHYDELGLLRPAEVDTQTGYRYYRAAQLGDLNRILVLRDLGFRLEQIGELVEKSLTTDQLRAMLLMRKTEVEQELARQGERLQLLEQRIDELERGTEDTLDDVLLRPLPAIRLLSTRARLGSFEQAQALVGTLQGELPARVKRRRSLGRMLVLQHATHFEPDALDLEVGFTIEGELDPATHFGVAGHEVSVRDLPAVPKAAICVRVGFPQAVHRAVRNLARVVEAAGLRLAGENRELFLKPPSAREAPVIELQFPVQPPDTP